MPTSESDPVSSALRLSLSTKETARELDQRLAASSAKILLTHIKYESVGSYNSIVLDKLKEKYIVLNTNSGAANGGSGSSSIVQVNNKMRPEPDSVLPTPKHILFPAENVKLGWQDSSHPVGAGMFNVGNTCYLNSTLQALFHIPAFVNWLQSDLAHIENCGTINGNFSNECVICAMRKTLRDTLSKCNTAIKPLYIYTKLKLICKHLVHGQQEDAHEFLRYLIESMEKAYLSRCKGNKLDNYSKETTPLNQIFGGYIRTEVTCRKCRGVSTTFQHFQDLLLDIRRANTLSDALETYFAHERLEGEDAYRCELCHGKVSASKKFSLEKPPMVLCIQLKRFSVLGGKLNKHVEFQQGLDMTRFLCPQSQYRAGQPLKYRLVSLVLHMGSSVNCGHYTAVAQTANRQWYQFDDSSVRPISIKDVLDMNAYIIIYELDKSEARVPHSVHSKPETITSDSQQNSINGKYLNKLNNYQSTAPIIGSINHANGSVIKVPNKLPLAVSNRNSTVSSSLKLPRPEKPQANNSILPSLSDRARIVFSQQQRCPTINKNGIAKQPSNGSLVPYVSGDSSDSDLEPSSKDPSMPSLNTPSPPRQISSDNCPSTSTNNVSPRKICIPKLSTAKPISCVDSSPAKVELQSNINMNSVASKCKSGSWQVTDLSLHNPCIQTTANATTAWSVSESRVVKNNFNHQIKENGDCNIKPPTNNHDSQLNLQKKPANGHDSQFNVQKKPANGHDSQLNAQKKPANGHDSQLNVQKNSEKHCNGHYTVQAEKLKEHHNTHRSCGSGDRLVQEDASCHLNRQSHQGYAGVEVATWGGERTHIDREIDIEKLSRKRNFDSDYNEELDSGRVKKVKYERREFNHIRSKYNKFQECQNQKIRWNNPHYQSNYYYLQSQYRKPNFKNRDTGYKYNNNNNRHMHFSGKHSRHWRQ